jgi:hypothetical protein
VCILRKNTGVVVVVVGERLDLRKTHMARKRMALAVHLHKVCLSFLPFSHNSSLTRNLQPTHMHASHLSHPRTTNIPIQSYSIERRRNFIIVRNSRPSTINIQVEILEQEGNMIPSNLISRTTHRHIGTLRFRSLLSCLLHHT